MSDEIKGYTLGDVTELVSKRAVFSSKQYYLKQITKELGETNDDVVIKTKEGGVVIGINRHREAFRQILNAELDFVTAKIKAIDDYCNTLPQMPGVE